MATQQPPAWWNMTLEQREEWTKAQRAKEEVEASLDRMKDEAKKTHNHYLRRVGDLEQASKQASQVADVQLQKLQEAQREVYLYRNFVEENDLVKDFQEWRTKREKEDEEPDFPPLAQAYNR